MNEENTKDLPDRRSFEERVFARFDAMDGRFDSLETRLEKLEARNYDTKPIWERALAAIGEAQQEVSAIGAKVQNLENEVGLMRADQRTTRDELIDVRRTLRSHVGERVDMILKFLIEDREDIRDAEARIRELESKLA